MNKYLWVLIAFIFLLSIYNWYEEGYFSFWGFCVANLGAVAAPILANLILQGVSKFSSFPQLPFKLVAIFSVALSMVAYTYYTLNGRAENSDTSATQIHVIVAPIVLLLFTLAAELMALVICSMLKLAERKNA
ncbi:hypothetical protein ACJJIP_15170 [Microbulbifer sp. VTAC004]|uniref:hypothetical protein n=1 Tax=unclassified Microbulbifer TaxID=2619833 RepID=UPI00403A6887